MLEGKVNLNLQNDFLVNRNKTASNNQPQKQNTEVHDKKSKIFWSAAGAAALIATVTGGIYYLRRGKASAELDEVINTLGEEVAHFEPAQSFLNKKFNFDFAESLFSKFKAEILETPEKIVIGKQENQLTHIIKNSIDDRRIIKFNEDKSFIQVINGDNILNIYRPADGEFSQISELFIGDSIIPVVNKQGKNYNILSIGSSKPIHYDSNTGKVLNDNINSSVAQKIVRQYDLEDFLDCYELISTKPLGEQIVPSINSTKLFNQWRRKLDTDETIQDIAENLGKPKSEIYKMLHSQKFRQTVKNQQDILDSGYDKVAQTLADDFGLKVDIQRPVADYRDILRTMASDEPIASGVINSHVIDGFDMTPKMTNCTYISNVNPVTNKSCDGGHLTYNPEKSFISYNDEYSSIERYIPEKITDARPKYTTLASDNGGFTLIERESHNELSLISRTGTARLKIKYKGDLKNPEIESAELTRKIFKEKGESPTVETKDISIENENLALILKRFSQDMYHNQNAIAENNCNFINAMLSQIL